MNRCNSLAGPTVRRSRDRGGFLGDVIGLERSCCLDSRSSLEAGLRKGNDPRSTRGLPNVAGRLPRVLGSWPHRAAAGGGRMPRILRKGRIRLCIPGWRAQRAGIEMETASGALLRPKAVSLSKAPARPSVDAGLFPRPSASPAAAGVLRVLRSLVSAASRQSGQPGEQQRDGKRSNSLRPAADSMINDSDPHYPAAISHPAQEPAPRDAPRVFSRSAPSAPPATPRECHRPSGSRTASAAST